MTWVAAGALVALVIATFLLRKTPLTASHPKLARLVRLGAWCAGMAVTVFIVRPDTVVSLLACTLPWFFVASTIEIGLSWKSVALFLSSLPTASILDEAPTLVSMWIADIALPHNLRTAETYFLKFRFRRRLVPLSHDMPLDRDASLRGTERDEDCPLETGTLRLNKKIRLKLQAPAFSIASEYDTEIDRLEDHALNIPCMPKPA
jgi:hypothetical protein